MKRRDVVVLQIDLDEGFPVVIAGVLLDATERVVVEIELIGHTHLGQIARDLRFATAFEQHAVPALYRRLVQVQAGIIGKMRRAEQFACAVVGPAVQRADDILRVAPIGQHDGLAVAANVGQQAYLAFVTDQRATVLLAGEDLIVAFIGHHQLVTDVLRAVFEQQFEFALIQGFVKVDGDGQLGLPHRQFGCVTRMGHGFIP